MGLASSQHFLPVTRALLTAARGASPMDIFRREGIPKTPGYRTVRFYEVHGAVRTEHGIEADARRILTLQGGLRADRALPDRTVTKAPPLEQAVQVFQALEIPHALAFQTAANMHAYFEPAGIHTLYVQRAGRAGHGAADVTAAVAQRLAKHPASSRAHQYQLFVDDLGRLDVRSASRGDLTSPLQTLLDLCVHGRTAAHREYMFDQLQKQGVLHD